MGLLRVYLAIAVVVAHSERILGIPMITGRTAVECFFVISGFYMAMTLPKYLRRPKGGVRTFYLARALRIVPIYLVVLALSLVLVLVGGNIFIATEPQRVGELLSLPLSTAIPLVVSNITLFTQDWSLFFAVGDNGLLYFTPEFNQEPTPAYLFFLVPQAWTIALELTFYLIAPFLARRSTRTLMIIGIASVALRIAFAVPGYTRDPWSYRFFPFELSLFIAGMLAFRFYTRNRSRALYLSNWPLVAIMVVLIVFPVAHYIPRVAPFALLLIPFVFAAFVPAVFARTQYSKLDKWIGELSYPVYIVHILVLSALASLGIYASGPGAVIVSLLAGYLIVVLLERPIERLRQRNIQKSLSGDPALARAI